MHSMFSLRISAFAKRVKKKKKYKVKNKETKLEFL